MISHSDCAFGHAGQLYRKGTSDSYYAALEAKEQRQRYATMPTEHCGSPKDAKSLPIGVQLPPLTLKAAKARIAALNTEEASWLCGCDVPSPNSRRFEREGLEAFIACETQKNS